MPPYRKGVAHDKARAAFVSATAGMLHGLGLKVYAEGVQDRADIPALHDCGVDGDRACCSVA